MTKGFLGWAYRHGRLPINPLLSLSPLAAGIDPKHTHGVLSPDEFARLLDAARAGRPSRKISGADRRLLYLVAGFTGLRAQELSSLAPSSFNLDPESPYVLIRAAKSKNQKEARIPLHPEIAEELRPWRIARPIDPSGPAHGGITARIWCNATSDPPASPTATSKGDIETSIRSGLSSPRC